MLKVEFQEESQGGILPYLGRKHTIEFDEIGTLEELEAAFATIALAMGFTYVAKVNAVKLASMKTEEDADEWDKYKAE